MLESKRATAILLGLIAAASASIFFLIMEPEPKRLTGVAFITFFGLAIVLLAYVSWPRRGRF